MEVFNALKAFKINANERSTKKKKKRKKTFFREDFSAINAA